eukprot:gene13839-18664_t
MPQRIGEAQFVVLARDLDATEGAQVIGDELGVEQAVIAGFQALQQMRHGDFRAVRAAVKHRFAEKRRPDRDAIEP